MHTYIKTFNCTILMLLSWCLSSAQQHSTQNIMLDLQPVIDITKHSDRSSIELTRYHKESFTVKSNDQLSVNVKSTNKNKVDSKHNIKNRLDIATNTTRKSINLSSSPQQIINESRGGSEHNFTVGFNIKQPVAYTSLSEIIYTATQP